MQDEMSCMSYSTNLQLDQLSDDVLGCILFSLYLSNRPQAVFSVMLVNKNFYCLSKKCVSSIHFLREQNNLTFDAWHRSFPKLQYLDLSMAKVLPGQAVQWESLGLYGGGLKGLNLRNACVTNYECVFIAQMTNLRFLDVSRPCSASSDSLSDEGVLQLASLSHLCWLDMSCCGISNTTVERLSTGAPLLSHLSVQCCMRLTDEACTYLSALSLRSLDISGCWSLTAASIDTLCSKRSVTHSCTCLIVM